MLPNDDLARWGEPPADERELELADLLAEVLEPGPVQEETLRRVERSRDTGVLAQVGHWIEEVVATVAEEVGLPSDPGAWGRNAPKAIELRLVVSRLVAGVYQAVASTHAAPCVVRDLRRIPEDADRVTLRTGERVRIEV